MAESLISLGLDVGTTTTQLILSRLQVQNLANAFSVPNLQITQRQILYKSPVYFTPLLDESHVDGAAIRTIVETEYAKAGIRREQVDTGAIIITGETSRKENAHRVLLELSGFAGDFVVATAGPDLESILAAKGAGAVSYSEKTGQTLLHMDIGGGTCNMALIQAGQIVSTGCLNIGGRLLKFDNRGNITYVSPVLESLTDLKPGDHPSQEQIEAIAQRLTNVLEMAAGLRPKTPLLDKLLTQEVSASWKIPGPAILSFSGGVADCIEQEQNPLAFGDIGPALGKAVQNSLLCRGQYILGQETIRATVIGAGSHATQLSGSTVFYKNIDFPLKNLPVAAIPYQDQLDHQKIREKLKQTDTETPILFFPGFQSPRYEQVKALAQAIYQAVGDQDVYVCLEKDMAKALGHCLMLLRSPHAACLCMDGLHLTQNSFLDVGEAVGPALPVVIKTLVFNHG